MDEEADEKENSVVQLASCLAAIVLRVPISVPISGVELFKQFIQSNLGSLSSLGLLSNDDKLRFFGFLESPPTLLINGTDTTLDGLKEAWKNRILKAPENCKILTFGLVNNLRINPEPQRSQIALSDLVMLAISDLNNKKLAAQSITIQQHLVSKFDEMKIPAVSAIEYCLSQLQKQKQLYFYENGFHRSPRQKSKKNKSGCPEMVSVAPLASSTMTTPSPTHYQLSSAVLAVNTPVKIKPKPNANTTKQKNKKPSKFSVGLKKLRQSIRLSTGSKNNSKNKREIQKQNSDSGVDTCKGSVNPSLASNSFIVMTPNESAIVQITGQSEDISLEITPSPTKEKNNHIRIDRNHASQGHLKIPQLINYQSDMESVASSRYTARIKTKPKVRNGRRRSSKKAKLNSSLNTSQMNSTSMTNKNDSSRESSSRPSSGMKSSMVSGTRPVSPDDVHNVIDHNTSALTGTDFILDYGYNRGESTMLLDNEVDQINRRICDFGETSSITINAPDDMEEDLKFTPSIKSQTLPRQSRLFAPMSDPVPRSSSRLSHNKSPLDSKMLQTSKPMYLRKSKSTTPGNHGNFTVFIGRM